MPRCPFWHESACIFDKPDIFRGRCTQVYVCTRYTRDKEQSDHPNNLGQHWKQEQLRQSFQLTNREIIWDKLTLRHCLCTLSRSREIFIHMKASFTWRKTKLPASCRMEAVRCDANTNHQETKEKCQVILWGVEMGGSQGGWRSLRFLMVSYQVWKTIGWKKAQHCDAISHFGPYLQHKAQDKDCSKCKLKLN